MKSNKIQSGKNNGIKNILNYFLIIVFATIFWACNKYETETRVNEVRIVSASITEVGTTTADFTIIISGFRVDSVGAFFGGNAPNVNFSWTDWENDWQTNTNKIVFQMKGLWPGTTYTCQAYIQVDTLKVYSEMEYFTTNK